MTQPPVAEKVVHVHTDHGVQRPDPYHWLKDKANPAVLEHLTRENDYNESQTAHLADVRSALYDEMLARIQEDDTTVPVRKGEWWYYKRTKSGNAYALHCRRRGDLDAPEDVYVDENLLAEGHDYFKVDTITESPDHTLVAWLQDLDGSEAFTLYVRDLATGATRQLATGLKWGFVWSADSSCVLATRPDHAHRPWQVVRVDCRGDAPETVIYEDPDERFFVGVDRTRDHRYLIIESASKVTSEVHLLDGDDPSGTPKVVWPRKHDVLYNVAHGKGVLYIHSNDRGRNFRLISVPADAPMSTPIELVPHRQEVYLRAVSAFAEHLVLWERQDGLPTIRILDLNSGDLHSVDFPEPSYEVSSESNPTFDTHELRFSYTSPRTPNSVFVFDTHDKRRTLLKVKPVVGYDPRYYTVDRIWATSWDGTRVPMTILRRADQTLDKGPHPVLLRAYGSYGYSYPVSFRSTWISLVDRGIIIVLAHVRGGSEMGRPWYEAGKFEHKTNTFRDFIECAEHLVNEGWATSDRLAIQGGSAGGLLMGAVLNMKPELFAACIANVPFVDALNTMLDATLPLTVPEYEEWGDPNQRGVFDQLRAYSPYDNVDSKPYPEIFATAGLNDPRVGYWEPAKWVAAIREHSTSDHQVLLRTHMGAGHGGASGRYGYLDDLTWEYAFLLDRLALLPADSKADS